MNVKIKINDSNFLSTLDKEIIFNTYKNKLNLNEKINFDDGSLFLYIYEIIKSKAHKLIKNNSPSSNNIDLIDSFFKRIEDSFFYEGILKRITNKNEDKILKVIFLISLKNKEYYKVSLDEENFVLNSLKENDLEISSLALSTLYFWKNINKENYKINYEIKINQNYLKTKNIYRLLS